MDVGIVEQNIVEYDRNRKNDMKLHVFEVAAWNCERIRKSLSIFSVL